MTTAIEEEHSRMIFSKLKQVVSQKFGYGVKETNVANAFMYRMSPGDFTRIIRNGALYHIKRIYRELFTFRVETVNVKVQEGELKGRKMVSILGKPYYRFQGIPYAKPPLGPLRFKAPEPPEPWKGVRSALKEGNIATQTDIITGLTRGGEDCLYLNVFTPELPQEGVPMEGKPVLVWIHGGGFHFGSGNAEVYGPDFLLEEDVLLVTFNYRLGVLGFLYTGTEDAPGNVGMKDMVQALKWVQQNIAVFGGDPNNVTIFGESAGGAAVHLLMLSPLGKGLFHKAISQSGSALCPWAVNDDPLEAGFKLGKAFGLETKDPKVLVEYLRKISPKVLAKKQSIALSEQSLRESIPLPFLPCVEAPSPNSFLTEHPRTLLQNGKLYVDVPYITGTNEMEGLLLLKLIISKSPSHKVIESDFERLVPRYLNLRYGSDQSKATANKIREFYFNNKPFNKETHKEYAELATDTYFSMPVMITAKMQSKFAKSSIYKYHFMYDGDLGLMKKLLNLKQIPGPAHADEIGYLFHVPILGQNCDKKSMEMKVCRKMIKLWVNFAKTGNPTPEPEDPDVDNVTWKAFSEENPYYLVIQDYLSVAKNMTEERIRFWNDILTTS